jgi:hypothetical protein
VGAQVLLIFRARLLLHQPHIVLEGHRLSMQALDWNRLDALCWLTDVEALFGGVHPAGDSLTSQVSAHVVIFAVDRQRPIGPDRARKGLPIDLDKQLAISTTRLSLARRISRDVTSIGCQSNWTSSPGWRNSSALGLRRRSS